MTFTAKLTGEILSLADNIRPGDTVYVISDLMKLMGKARAEGEAFDRDEMLNLLQEKVTEEGTLLIPAFNWDFCKGKAFDIRKSPSQTGALGNAALARTDFRRTAHPIYSFLVWGRLGDMLLSADPPNAFGKGSIFDLLDEQRAKALVIGLNATDGLTFIHHVEQMTGVPYRYEKIFTAPYTDAEGITSEKKYSMYVRDLEKDPRYLDSYAALEALLAACGASETKTLHGIPVSVVDLHASFPVFRDDILHNDSRLLYRYHGQRTD